LQILKINLQILTNYLQNENIVLKEIGHGGGGQLHARQNVNVQEMGTNQQTTK